MLSLDSDAHGRVASPKMIWIRQTLSRSPSRTAAAHRDHMLKAFLLGLLAIAPTAPAALLAQLAPSRQSAPEWAFEVQTRERWMHGRQQPRWTPFTSDRMWLVVDSLRAAAPLRRMYVTMGRSSYGRDSAFVDFDSTGRRVTIAAGAARYVAQPGAMARDSLFWHDRQLRRINGALGLLETRLWDVVPTMPAASPRPGLTWTDSIDQSAVDGPYHQTIRGTRFNRITGDTVVGGRHLLVVRDSASVRYDEAYLEIERTLDTMVAVTRETSGIIRGVELYDPTLRLFRARDDTTRLGGDAVLRYPDGRALRTAARYERMRRYTLYDTPGYIARQSEIRAEVRRNMGGLVVLASNEVQARLASGDRSVADSLMRVWRDASDPESASRAAQLLMGFGRHGVSARFDSLRTTLGDTVRLYQLLADHAYSRTPTDSGDVRAMLVFMDDPSIAWDFGLSRDWLYENLVQGLTTWPPAAVGRSGGSVACTPAACALLADQWRTAREPRLRDVGLVALASTDPARWGDTLLALAGPTHPLFRSAAMLLKGVGAGWPASSKPRIPAPNSDWRAWLAWMNGRGPRDTISDAEKRLRPMGWAGQPRFEESHATAIRFYMARSGRDIVGEIRRGYETAASDSARLVFGLMLQRLGEVRLTEDEIARAFASGVPERGALAREALVSSFEAQATAMDSATAAPLMARLLAAAIDSAPLWRSGAADLVPRLVRGRPMVHAPMHEIILNGEGVPSSVRARWAARLRVMTPAEWSRRDPREAGVFLSLTPVRVWGRFARVELSVSERLARGPGDAPQGYASAQAYYLMRVNGEWLIVATRGWVT